MSEIPEPKRCIEILKENGCPEAVINHYIALVQRRPDRTEQRQGDT